MTASHPSSAPLCVLVDTNVLLDVLADRRPWVAEAAAIWAAAERRQIRAVVAAISFINLYYIVQRLGDHQRAMMAIAQVRRIFGVAACDELVIDQAIAAEGADFEDAVQVQAAAHAQADLIITRNLKHFSRSPVPAVTPAEFLAAQALRDERQGR